MNMWVQTQILPPGMKNADSATFHAIVAVPECLERAPNVLEQIVVKPFAVEQTNGVEFFGHRKHDVKMLNLQRFVHTVFDPKSLFRCLTLRAMSVTTAIITDTFLPAAITSVFVPTQSCCAAFGQGIERAQYVSIGLEHLDILPAETLYYIGYFEL
jgi:hypothetical protein